jgi:hypothetical protein
MKALSTLFIAMSICAPIGMAQSRYAADVLALNPLGYWRLEGNAVDATANGNAGTLQGGVTFTGAGVGAPIGDSINQAGSFNSSLNQFVNIPAGEPTASSLFDLEWNHAFTMMIWVKTSEVGSILLAKEEGSSAFRGPYIFIDSGGDGVEPVGSGRFAVHINSSSSSVNGIRVSSNVSVNDNLWHFVAATYDGSGQASGVRLYVDGNPVAMNIRQNNLNGGTILNNAPVTIGSRDGGTSPTNGLLDEAAIFGVALTPAQIKQLQNDTVVTQNILPQFTFGGGWYSALYFTNTGTTPISFPITFTSDAGTPLLVPSIGSATTTVNLAARGTAIIEAFNAGPQVQGYASAQLPAGVVGYGIFRQSIAGRDDQEAVVPLSGASATTSTLIYDDTNFTTTFSLANLSSSPIAVTATARNNSGQTVGTAVIAVVPNGKVASTLRGLAGLSGIAGTRGSVDFTANTGNIAVLGLRFSAVAFTSVPTSDR